MATWQLFNDEAPQLAEVVQARLRAADTHVLASLRRDGSPRVSGTEVFASGPDLVIGSMDGAVKTADLHHDPRFALHTHPARDSADAKLTGRAHEIAGVRALRGFGEQTRPPGKARLFRLDMTEVVITEVGDDQQNLLIKRWRPEEGVVAFKRYQ